MDQQDELDWRHKVSDIRERRTFKRVATEAECAAITAIFGDAICRALTATYEIRPLAPGRYRMVGDVEARIEQTCGVTLDPVEQLVDETFDVEFRSGSRRYTDHDADFDPMGDDDPEPIEHGEIVASRFICEIVASALDPFPRAPDAELDQAEAGDTTPAPNPFAALQSLKKEG